MEIFLEAIVQLPRSPGLKIGSVWRIPIYLHMSWFIIFLLLTMSLGTQFTEQHPLWSPEQHWVLGILTSLLFFGSVIFHELSHSVVAMHYKIPVARITLFVFGGLASIGREPESALQEFNIAIAGPLSSYFLAGVFWGLGRALPGNEMFVALTGWLAWINVILATFNLVPGFPLDGGRLLRSAAWGITGNYTKSTRIASGAGRVVAYGMIGFGAWDALRGDWTGGLWIAFIGWFLLTASQESYSQVAMRESLAGLRATDVMTLDLPSVARDISLEDYGQEVLRTGRRCHLVVTNGQLSGLISVHGLSHVPREDWNVMSVQAVMMPLARMRWASPDEPVLRILDRMQSEDVNQMPVLQTEPSPHVVGMITRETILRVIQTRAEVRSLPI
jgi:Zn-dependent protease/predicted transcriptional regulator